MIVSNSYLMNVVIIVLYFLFLVSIGWYFSTKTKTFKHFIQSDAHSHIFLLTAVIFTSSIGGGTIIGISEKICSGHIEYSYASMMVIIIDIVIAQYLLPRLIKYKGCETIGDIVYLHYGNAGRFIAGLSSIVISIGLISAQLNVAGKVLQYIFNINNMQAVILSALMIVIYTTLGGFKSILFSNQIQFVAIILSIPILLFYEVKFIGISEFYTKFHSLLHSLNTESEKNIVYSTLFVLLSFTVMNLLPNFVQRALIASDYKKTQLAIYIKSLVYFLFLLIIIVNSIASMLISPKVEGIFILHKMIDILLPTFIQSIVIIGIFAAVTSTADSDINITSIVLVKDFLIPMFNINNQFILLILVRIFSVFVGVISIIIAIRFTYVIDLVLLFSGFWGPVILPVLILLLFGIVVPKLVLAIAVIVGIVAFIYWEFILSCTIPLTGAFVGTILNFLVLILYQAAVQIIQKFKNLSHKKTF
ncbi:sodium:solute symporter family protein [Rickettsia endosymbiont of Cardiosporidium cionae]|uniref:sodium:solute symporter family protein n=1 Tax=Rickettsia endosymbiont of Cardiosporidium cionae TaxID=2777155 RepID=UPI0018947339|nr:sodium:solute symporter family protein [Rickettsia endosymbiont of Cardiosporidium cionae]KAF8818294.1 sodium:solute symporter family protein [Rickettsia endosymbiont of Cardiosporidium cionae]